MGLDHKFAIMAGQASSRLKHPRCQLAVPQGRVSA
jgi:hypothetical protein